MIITLAQEKIENASNGQEDIDFTFQTQQLNQKNR